MYSWTKVFSALELASIRHSGQTRKGNNKTPYINHPIGVINVLAKHGEADTDLLAAAALHDVIEDTAGNKEEIDQISSHIKENFGEKVLRIVLEVSDDKSLPYQKRKDLQIINTPGLSPEAKKLKIADKICNIRDMIKNPPPDWTIERKRTYLEWAVKVIEGARNSNQSLEKDFEETIKFAKNSLSH